MGIHHPPVAPYLARVLLHGLGGERSGWKLGKDDAAQVPPGLQEAVEASRPGTSPPGATAATGAFDRFEADTGAAELLERRRFEPIEQQTGWAAPASPLHAGWPPSSR